MPRDLQRGDRVGPYTLAGVLGRGGMGVVYLAHHTALGHEVAVKLIHPEDDADKESRARFRREAQAAAHLADVPGLVGVRDFGEEADGRLWFAMPRVAGQSLEDLLIDHLMAPRRAATIVAAAARAVHAAHERGVLHRDLKPANVIVAPDDAVSVTDFGLARFTAAGPAVTKLTQSGYFVGTPSYMSPEQVYALALDCRADVYGLGATLYDALTGNPPFSGPTDAVTLTLVLRMDPVPPSRTNPLVPPDLDAIVARAMEKKPDDRYATALELAEDLERFLGDAPVLAPRLNWQRSLGRWLGQRRLEVAVGAALFVTIAAVGGQAWWQAAQPTRGDTGAAAAAARATAVQQMLAEYERLRVTTAGQMRVLQDVLHGVPLRTVAIEDQLRQIRDATRAVAQSAPALGLPRAWEGLAMVLAGQTEAGLEGIRSAVGGPDAALVHLLLARAHLARYAAEARMPGVRYATGQALIDDFAETPAMQVAHEAAAAALAAAKADPSWSALPPNNPVVRYVEALAAMMEGRSADAESQLRELGDLDETAAEAALLHGILRYMRGDQVASLAIWRRAAARNWPNAIRLCFYAEMQMARAHGTDPDAQAAAFVRLRALLDQLQSALGPSAAVHQDRGVLFLARAGQLDDPRRAAEINDAGIAEFERAIALQPNAVNAHLNRAVGLRMRARMAAEQGQPDRALRVAAVKAFDAAVERFGLHPMLCRGRAPAVMELAQVLEGTGEDPVPLLTKAVGDLDRALAADPNDFTTRVVRASARHLWGKALWRQGKDPEPLYQAAFDDLTARIEQGGRERFPVTERASVMLSRALAASEPAVAMRFLLAAIKDATAVLDQLPGDWQALLLRAKLLRQLARVQPASSGQPERTAEAAERDLGYALQAGGPPGPIHESRGAVRADRARRMRTNDAATITMLRAAGDDYDIAVRQQPGRIDPLIGRLGVLEHLIRAMRARRGDVADLFTTAFEHADALVAAAPARFDARLMRGRLFESRARDHVRHRRSPKPDLLAALTDYDAAARLAPASWKCQLFRGLTLKVLGRFDEAEAARDVAKRLAPNEPLVDALTREIDAARAVARRKSR